MTLRELSRRCPLCEGSELRRIEAFDNDYLGNRSPISVLECNHCAFAWQWPRARSAQESQDYFGEQYERKTAGSYFEPQRRSETATVQADFLRFVDRGARRLLDVGAGDGTFIQQAAQRGWDCVGCEIAVVDEFDQRVGVGRARLLVGSLADMDEREFDVVTMWDVLEHLEDPEQLLTSAAERLRATGALVIETGNYCSAGRAHSESDWWGYQADHRWYFSPDTLKRLLARLGFINAALCKKQLTKDWSGNPGYAGPSRFRTLKSITRNPVGAPKIIRRDRNLRQMAKRWPSSSGIEIFTVAATRDPDYRWSPAAFLHL